MSLHALSSSELLLAVKTHVAYINLQDNVVDKFELPVEEKEKRPAGNLLSQSG